MFYLIYVNQDAHPDVLSGPYIWDVAVAKAVELVQERINRHPNETQLKAEINECGCFINYDHIDGVFIKECD